MSPDPSPGPSSISTLRRSVRYVSETLVLGGLLGFLVTALAYLYHPLASDLGRAVVALVLVAGLSFVVASRVQELRLPRLRWTVLFATVLAVCVLGVIDLLWGWSPTWVYDQEVMVIIWLGLSGLGVYVGLLARYLPKLFAWTRG